MDRPRRSPKKKSDPAFLYESQSCIEGTNGNEVTTAKDTVKKLDKANEKSTKKKKQKADTCIKTECQKDLMVNSAKMLCIGIICFDYFRTFCYLLSDLVMF